MVEGQRLDKHASVFGISSGGMGQGAMGSSTGTHGGRGHNGYTWYVV